MSLCYYKEYRNKKNVNYLYSFCKLIYDVKKFCLGLLAYPPVFFVYLFVNRNFRVKYFTFVWAKRITVQRNNNFSLFIIIMQSLDFLICKQF